jgi:hypothetical protein
MKYPDTGRNKRIICISAIALLTITSFIIYLLLFGHNTTKINGLGFSMNVPNTKISFSKKVWDIGCIKQYDQQNIIVNFKNYGDKPLLVYDVNSLCGCVKIVEWTHSPISPRGEGNLIIRVNTSNPGKINKEILVFSNSGSNPEKLIVKADVRE